MRRLLHPVRKLRAQDRCRGTSKIEKVHKVPTITIIDDDEEVRVAIESLIQSHGLDVHAFASAEEFLDSSVIDQTTCLVTDVQMPGMSGVDLQDALIKRGCKLPMIFITAFPEERLRRQVEAAGALGFLSKPFDARRLMACIDKALKSDHRVETH
jgi:FixJ family two-component response regulator